MKFLVTKLKLIISKTIQNSVICSHLINKMTKVVNTKTQLDKLDDVTGRDETKKNNKNRKDLNNNENLAPNKNEDKKNSENELIDLFESNLKLNDTNKAESKLFESMDISGAAKYLLKCKNVIFMTGAGISTSVINCKKHIKFVYNLFLLL